MIPPLSTAAQALLHACRAWQPRACPCNSPAQPCDGAKLVPAVCRVTQREVRILPFLTGSQALVPKNLNPKPWRCSRAHGPLCSRALLHKEMCTCARSSRAHCPMCSVQPAPLTQHAFLLTAYRSELTGRLGMHAGPSASPSLCTSRVTHEAYIARSGIADTELTLSHVALALTAVTRGRASARKAVVVHEYVSQKLCLRLSFAVSRLTAVSCLMFHVRGHACPMSEATPVSPREDGKRLGERRRRERLHVSVHVTRQTTCHMPGLRGETAVCPSSNLPPRAPVPCRSGWR